MSALLDDPDTRLVAALRRSHELDAAIEALDEWDQENTNRLAAELSDCHILIAESPCHGASGIAAKLAVLKWLRENGSTAEWEEDLLRTALAALEGIAPEARL
ncbi:MAG: hypothetical protein ACM33T_10150 [Solirubrobacterales bacterium]